MKTPKWAMVVFLGALLAPDPAEAQQFTLDREAFDLLDLQAGRCECPDVLDPGYEDGVFWSGDRTLSLAEIAALASPVLWFSVDEPLFVRGNTTLPDAHPCDLDNDQPVVYYQLNRLETRGDDRVGDPAENDPDFWDKTQSVVIRYYFYYPEDVGVGGHPHDLEVAEFFIYLEETDDGCYRLRMSKVVGFAHGVDWYYNNYNVRRDTWFPITLMVEEGKHAVAPDRNADGVYTPGYDVNVRIKDAWGVRDVFASSTLASGSYQTFMTKSRDYRARVFPEEHSLQCKTGYNRPETRSPDFAGRYELRAANQVRPCAAMQEPAQEKLVEFQSKHEFGSEYAAQQNPVFGIGDRDSPLTYASSWFPPLAMRFDRQLGVAVTLGGLEIGGPGYLVGRVNVAGEDVSVEGMLTPSAAQFLSWYVAAGGAYERPRMEDPETGEDVFGEHKWQFVSEIGVKFRFQVSGVGRVFSLGYKFAGVRFGFRNSGFRDFNDSRLIIEVGAGIW